MRRWQVILYRILTFVIGTSLINLLIFTVIGLVGWIVGNKVSANLFWGFAWYCSLVFLISYFLTFLLPQNVLATKPNGNQATKELTTDRATAKVIFLIEVLGDPLFAKIISQNDTAFDDGGRVIEFPYSRLILDRLQYMELLVNFFQTKLRFSKEEVRVWFVTKQLELYNNQSPEEVLAQNWHPEDPAAMNVAELALKATKTAKRWTKNRG